MSYTGTPIIRGKALEFKVGDEITDTMYDVRFDSDTEPDPVPPRVAQPHMYGADWTNIVARPEAKLPKAVKIPKAARPKEEKKATPKKKTRRSLEGGE